MDPVHVDVIGLSLGRGTELPILRNLESEVVKYLVGGPGGAPPLTLRR